MTFIIAFVLAIPFFLYSTWAYSFALTHIYNWFLMEDLGTSPMTATVAMGLSVLFTLLSPDTTYIKKVDLDEIPEKKRLGVALNLVFGPLLRPWIIFILAYCAHLFFQ